MLKSADSFGMRHAFTLVEVLVASAILAIFSTGLVATTWRMMAFAEDEAEHMAADAYCHDVMWSVFSQKFENIESIDEFTIDAAKELPHIVSTDILGRTSVVYPLWRSQDRSMLPTCEVVAGGTATNKSITVTVRWRKRNGAATSHTMTVDRANVQRGG